MGTRRDVEVISVEQNPGVAILARTVDWPSFVTIMIGDAVNLLPNLGGFDLIFADAEGGKWEGLDLTISALRRGGQIIVDDMTPPEWLSDNHRVKTAEAKLRLTTDPRLIAVEIAWASGLILCTRHTS